MGGIEDAGKVDDGGDRRSNRRTALALFSVALVFFIGVIINRLLFN